MAIWQIRTERGGAVDYRSLKRFTGLAALTALKAHGRTLKSFERQIEPKVYGRVGNLEVRLARTRSEIRQAQRLRFQVFYEEMSAVPSRLAQFRRRDEDAYDAICDHLIVVDLDQTTRSLRSGGDAIPKVVGTYRVLRQDVAERGLGFYTASEYNIAPLLKARSPGLWFMELGRSCVLAPYRNKRSVELLWHGLWTYVREHKIDVMIGCASFTGVDVNEHAAALSLLHHTALAPPEWRCKAHPHLHRAMDIVAQDKINAKAAMKSMPPLIKAYVRLGAYVGDGAVIDRQFGTTDVLIIMPVANIDPRYFEHYGAPDETTSRIAAAIY